MALQPWLAAHQHISADGIGNQSSIEQAVARHSHSHSWHGVLGVGGISSGTEGYWAGLGWAVFAMVGVCSLYLPQSSSGPVQNVPTATF